MARRFALLTFLLAAAALLLADSQPSIAGTPSPKRLRLALFGGASDDAPASGSAARDGSLYITGTTTSNPFDGHASQSNDAYLVKFGKGGKRLWSRLIGGTDLDFGHGVAVGKDGSVYATGETASQSLNGVANPRPRAAYLVKFDRKGNVVWTRLLSGNGNESGRSVAVGKDGSIYVAGNTSSDKLAGQVVKGDNDIFVARYRPDGKLVRVTLLGGPGIDADPVMTADQSDGSVYVAGLKNGAFGANAGLGNAQAFLTRLDRKTNAIWSRNLGARDAIRINDIETTATSVFVGGVDRDSTFSGADATGPTAPVGFVADYDKSGRRKLTLTLSGGYSDSVDGIAARADGSLCVAGSSQASGDFSDLRMLLSLIPVPLDNGPTATVDGKGVDIAVGVAAVGNECWLVGRTTSPRIAGRINQGAVDIVVAKFR